jgi:glycosyltransferase involved in cell wall biosynthesis
MKKVSILMTCFNAENFLTQSIKSILKQNFKDYELVIIDDGSTDKSRNIINRFNNKKIRKFFLKKNIGRTKALNFGLKKCNAKYIAILDADDISNPERIKIQYNYLEENKQIDLVVTFFKQKFFNRKIKSISYNSINNFKKKLCYLNLIAHSSVMYRKNQIKKLKIYNQKYLYAQDYEMILKFLKRNKIGIIPKYLTTVNIYKDNMSNSTKYKKIVIRERIRLLFFSLKNFNFTFFELSYIWLLVFYLVLKYLLK